MENRRKYFVNADATNPSKDELEQILSEYIVLQYESGYTKLYKLDAFWKKMETASDDKVVKFLNDGSNRNSFNIAFNSLHGDAQKNQVYDRLQNIIPDALLERITVPFVRDQDNLQYLFEVFNLNASREFGYTYGYTDKQDRFVQKIVARIMQNIKQNEGVSELQQLLQSPDSQNSFIFGRIWSRMESIQQQYVHALLTHMMFKFNNDHTQTFVRKIINDYKPKSEK